jgi:hypothetical protein
MIRVTKEWLSGNHLPYSNLVSGWRQSKVLIKEEEQKSALHFICLCPILTTLRTQIFGKPILSVSEYEGMSASKSDDDTITKI